MKFLLFSSSLQTNFNSLLSFLLKVGSSIALELSKVVAFNVTTPSGVIIDDDVAIGDAHKDLFHYLSSYFDE